MNWDYVRVKKTNKQKGNKQKKLKKNLYDSLVRLYLTKKMVKSVIYLLFSYQTGAASGNIEHKPGMSHYIPCPIAE